MTRQVHRSALLFLLATACSPPPPVRPAPTIPPRVTRDAPLPKGPDLAHEVMATVVAADGERLLKQLTTPPDDGRALRASLLRGTGFEPLDAALDLKRPVAVALLNPLLLASDTVRPWVALVPVAPRERVDAALAELEGKGRVERTDWGAVIDGRVFVGLQNGYAVIAWRRDLLAGGFELLRPLCAAASRPDRAGVLAHVDVDNVYTAFGPQIEATVTRFAAMAAGGGDPQLVFATRGVRQLLSYAKSVRAVELLGDLDSGGLTITLRAEAKRNGPFAVYVGQQRPGPAWGMQYLPRDAVLAYTTSASPLGQRNDVDAAVDFLSGIAPRSRNDRDRWRRALERAAGTMGGELAYAVWPTREGGIGLGGAYKLSDPGQARAAVRAAYGELAAPLTMVVMRALALDPSKYLSRITLRQTRTLVGGAEADLVQVSVKWPEGSQSEKRSFEAMFGPDLVLATAFVGEQAVFAAGRDWPERLTTMVGVARGERAASVESEPAFGEALGFRANSRVSLSIVETGRMARLAGSLLQRTTDLGPPQRAALLALLAQVKNGVIIASTNAADGRLELTTHVPRDAVLGVARLNGALWRLALSPVVNPPMMPPLPIPPPHVTPRLTPAPTIPEGSL